MQKDILKSTDLYCVQQSYVLSLQLFEHFVHTINVHNVRFCQYFFGSLSVHFSQNRWGRFKPKSFLHILFPQSGILTCFDSSKFSILGVISSKCVHFRCKNRLSLLGPEKLQKEHSKGKVSFSIL